MDCKDIMLELEDSGAETEVKKELFKDKLKVTCYISYNRRIFFKIKLKPKSEFLKSLLTLVISPFKISLGPPWTRITRN